MKLNKKVGGVIVLFLVIAAVAMVSGCTNYNANGTDTGVKEAHVGTLPLVTEKDGSQVTVGQDLIIKRTHIDNQPGNVKYLAIVSAYSGDVIFSDTLVGQVMPDGKRLLPETISGSPWGNNNGHFVVFINNTPWYTDETPNPDGTYGTSPCEYFYYERPDGQQREIFLTGGMMPIISTSPIDDFGQVNMHVVTESK